MIEPLQHTALIVDDEPDIRELIALTLKRMGIRCVEAQDLTSAYELLKKEKYDLCISDLRLPDGSGLDLLNTIQNHCPELPVAMITAHGSMDTAIEALKAGAFDFVNKPVELQTLRDLVSSALKLQDTDSSTPAIKPADSHATQLIGKSEAIRKIRTTIGKLARSQAPVYISGESGTGKELVARLIHEMGPRVDKPFIAVNCGAIPAELMEGELFGHKKGSFTGAHTDRAGLFQSAHGGTLFLDEVADLPLTMQVKLLRAIQEKTIRPIGGRDEVHVDVRILSATHKDLAAMVRQEKFREDLFFRINVIQLHIPALREHRDDIPLLVDYLLQRLCDRLSLPPHRINEAALQTLCHHPFPGNIRELENTLERALTMSEEQTIRVEDLFLNNGPMSAHVSPIKQPQVLSEPAPNHYEDDSRAETEQALHEAEELGIEAYLSNIEKKILRQALEKCRYNKTATAKMLGLSFRALRYRLTKLGLD